MVNSKASKPLIQRYTANVGLIPTLARGPKDLIISDELNHGSIIDGVRLTKAQRSVYPHNDMGGLEDALKEGNSADRKLIIPTASLVWMAILPYWI